MYCSNIFNAKAGTAAIFLLAAVMAVTGCKKLVEIDRPRETVATEKVFMNNQNAYSALAGMYSMMMTGTDGSPNFSNGGLSIYAGMMADELESLAGVTNPEDYQFYDLCCQFHSGRGGCFHVSLAYRQCPYPVDRRSEICKGLLPFHAA
jgi:hypothetical protein